MSKFEAAFSAKEVLLADGATGTNLFNMGLEAGDAPELWNLNQPDKIAALYRIAIDAGSDLFLTNSFGGNASRLKLHNAQDQVGALNKAAAKLARDEVKKSGREILIGGSIGPSGEIMGEIGTLGADEAVALFREQAEALLEGGVDVLWLETISAPEEFRAAALAFGELAAPWVGTMSFDSAGRTMMGLTPPGFVELIASLPHKPLAFGANCGVGSSDLLRTIHGLSTAAKAQGIDLPIIAKGNAGIPKFIEGEIHYDGTPELMARYAQMARDLGAAIIGGCCGTGPEHLAFMRRALDDGPRSKAPSLEEISAEFGPFSSPNDGSEGGDGGGERRARRTRRRKS